MSFFPPCRRITELEALLDRVEASTQSHVESATAKLHEKIGETSVLKLENERLKVSAQGGLVSVIIAVSNGVDAAGYDSILDSMRFNPSLDC